MYEAGQASSGLQFVHVSGAKKLNNIVVKAGSTTVAIPSPYKHGNTQPNNENMNSKHQSSHFYF